MKRIVYAVLATVSGLVLLFSYRTSLEVVAPISDVAASSGSTPAAGSSGSSSGSSESDSSSGDAESDSSDSESDASSPPSESDSSSSDTGSGSSSSDTGSMQSSSALADGTYTGQAASTRFGPVRVQITVSGGAITTADAVDYPTSNPRDRQINQIAIPRLISETLSVQSARVDMISGATYTSEGYRQSLQNAIDQASS